MNIRYPPPGRLVDIGGRRLHIFDSGQGTPAVVFEAGISASSLNWTALRSQVAQLTRACAYDRASLGWSDPSPALPTASGIADDLHALLAGAGVPGADVPGAGVPPPYILVAHSYGGLPARAFASRYPDQVAGLILIDPLSPSEWATPTPVQARMLRRGVMLARRGAVLARLGVVRFALALLSSGGRRVPQAIARATSGEGESVISRLVGEVQKMPREVWPMVQAHWSRPQSFRGLAAYLESLPAISREAGAIELPTAIPLIILSAKNSTPSQIAERDELARRSIDGRHVVTNSGHWIHLDEPEIVVKAIQEMLDRSRKG